MKRIIVAGALVLLACVFLQGQTKLTGAEYWFDSDRESSVSLSVLPSSEISWAEDIDIGSLKYGLHTFHFRILDDSSRWSPVSSSFFVKRPDLEYGVPKELKKCAYWLDNDLAGVTEIPIANLPTFTLSEDLDISLLKRGLHVFNFRIQDTGNRWSPTNSSFFVYRNEESGSVNSAISSLEYWIDGLVEERSVLQMAESTTVNYVSDLDLSALNKGLHTFSYRFKNADGTFSSANTQYFIIRSEVRSHSGKNISAMEYWLDENIAEAIRISIVPEGDVGIIDDIDLSALKRGLHRFAYRFEDEDGGLSPAHTAYFFVRPNETAAAATGISAYRYWVGDGEMHAVQLEATDREVLMLADLDFRMLQKGEVKVNVQLCDDRGRWSGVVYDTVVKNSYPYAVLEADKEDVCVGDSVLLSAVIVDADTVVWDFANGLNSAEDSLKMAWDADGGYAVSLTLTDTTEKLSNEYGLESPISVHALPVVDLGDSIAIYDTTVMALDAGAGFETYVWNGEEGTNVYDVLGEDFELGEYFVGLQVENEFGCIGGDTVKIFVQSSVGIGLKKSIHLVMYPNPAHDYVHLRWDDELSDAVKVQIVDLRGRVLRYEDRVVSGAAIDVAGLKSGSYYVRMMVGAEVYVVPMVKM